MATLPSNRSHDLPSDARSNERGVAELGEILRQARERRGLTLAQVSTEMKISRQQLETLERGSFTNVPSGFYQRAQIRAYARVVQLNPDVALAALNRAAAPAVARRPPPEPPPGATPTVFRRRILIATGAVVVAVVLGRALGGREPVRDPATEAPAALGSPERRVAATLDEPAPQPAPPEASLSSPADRPSAPLVQPASREIVEPPPAAAAPVSPGMPAPVNPLADAAPPVAARNPEPVTAPEPAAPTAAPNAANSLVITTDPAGARVTVNGIAWGVTPLTIRYLPAGDKRVRVSRDGYAAEERVIHVLDGRPTNVAIPLRHAAP